MTECEVWVDIPGYDGMYQVSSLGRVRSLDRVVVCRRNGSNMSRMYEGKVLSPREAKNGYLYVGLWRNQKVEHKKVHRLVAEAFLQNQEGKPQVNHIDGDKLNNIATNLEWCTAQENILHAHSIGKSPRTASSAERNGYYKGKIFVYRDGILVDSFKGAAEGNSKGYPPYAVSRVVLGKSPHYKGFTFVRQQTT